MTKQITVALPDPGLPSERHEDDQIVWYHGQYGEFVIDNRDMNPLEPFPVCDEEGNAWSSVQLREMAAAALAAAEAIDARRRP
ncbi:MAG: hypothetical protein K2Y33_00840 [Mycolicibacterium frederiksbergense]|nr:hypothetical protein [Mycolicibacterium frederiksbergense]